MAKKEYSFEREGQIAFFNNYKIPYEDDNSVLIENTDGVYNGCILEFKLTINDLNAVLFQAIKYLSRLRISGMSVPATILLIDLNNTKAYYYKSIDYISSIQKVYSGAVSKNNAGFSPSEPNKIYDYSHIVDSSQLKKILTSTKINSQKYIPIDIDENCIVGWGSRYYFEKPDASKGDFLGDLNGQSVKVIGEIRQPRHFKDLINPYTGKTNEKFKYLMDCLNDRLSKKDLGAFYTPPPYASKATELVLQAIKNIPAENDYVILDRCAGTGNLESAFRNIKDNRGDLLLEHTIVATYEYYEYKVLDERIGHLVREIIPPTESDVVFESGKISNADALSKEFINNPIIKPYVDNPKCNIIVFENPPYRDDTSGMTKIKASNYTKKNNFVIQQMKNAKVSKTNEMANRFIWSAIKWYLKKPNDALIVFSPIKYYKSDKILDLKFNAGFVFNKKYFHASNSAITCIYWSNQPQEKGNKDNNEKSLEIYDIDDKSDALINIGKIKLEQVFIPITKLFPPAIKGDKFSSHYFSATNGTLEIKTNKTSTFNNNILGFVVGVGFGLSNPNLNFNLTRFQTLSKNVVRPLTKANYKNYLWLLAIKHFLMFERKWYENEYLFCCADGSNEFLNDTTFIDHCFIFANLDYYNKCRSTILPNNSVVKNELCFDINTIASKELTNIALNNDEQELISLWNKILEDAKKTKNYNSNFTYGVYQISEDLNTFKKIGSGKKKKTIYDYPILNGNLRALKAKLKDYFNAYIKDDLFKYKLIK